MRVRLVWSMVLSLCLGLSVAGAAHAQVPELPPLPALVGAVTDGSVRFGKQTVGTCGEEGYYAPHGKGLGFLQQDKSWAWRLAGRFTAVGGLFGTFDLCGQADVPLTGVPELGTAGACDAPRGTGGSGLFTVFDLLARADRAYRVADAGWPSAGSVMVVTGTVVGDDAPGALLMLLQRRTGGFCMHKDSDVPAVGTRYPQGGSYGDIAGVLVLTSPREAVQEPSR